MKSQPNKDPDGAWSWHDTAWRDPAQIASQWQGAAATDPRLLRYTTRGTWWEMLAASGITLLVTREYEHLVIAMCVADGEPLISFMQLPHPSGLAVDLKRDLVHIASTRNPNQVFDLAPAAGQLDRPGGEAAAVQELIRRRPLVPVRARFFPGCLYLHDLALIGGVLHGNSVGQNAVVRLEDEGQADRAWWPSCIERADGPVFGRNYLQLNSIAAGADLDRSYFSASADRISARRPGHRNFPVDGRGVIFAGNTRQPVVRGLTRPHSARLYRGRLWVDNSGYGELGVADLNLARFIPVARLPGWTRGLCFCGPIAFVGTSRVLPRFTSYAPGLDVERSVCGVHAVDVDSGQVVGSLIWPQGNQIFALDWAPSALTAGLPFQVGKRALARERALFYLFQFQKP